MNFKTEYDETINVTYIINCVELLEDNNLDFNEVCSKIGIHFGCDYKGIPKNDTILIDKILTSEDIKQALVYKAPKSSHQRMINKKIIAFDLRVEHPHIKDDELDNTMTRIINSEELSDELGITVAKLGETLWYKYKCIIDMELTDPRMMFQGKYTSKQIKKAFNIGGNPTKDNFIPQFIHRSSNNSTILFNHELLCKVLDINIDILLNRLKDKSNVECMMVDDDINLSINKILSYNDFIVLIKNL